MVTAPVAQVQSLRWEPLHAAGTAKKKKKKKKTKFKQLVSVLPSDSARDTSSLVPLPHINLPIVWRVRGRS